MQPVNFGNTSAHIYRAMLSFDSLPTLMRRADMICIPWGTKPNYYADPTIPFDPILIFTTPSGPVVLTWNGTYYEGDGYTFDYQPYPVDQWCLVGPGINKCFTTDHPLCEVFPSGFGYKEGAGLPHYYEILRFENALDDFGAYHHTRIEFELQDTDDRRGQ